MADQKFIFTGHRGSIGDIALKNGDSFDADPDWVRDQGFPAVAVTAISPEAVAVDKVIDEIRQDSEAVGAECAVDTALSTLTQPKQEKD